MLWRIGQQLLLCILLLSEAMFAEKIAHEHGHGAEDLQFVDLLDHAFFHVLVQTNQLLDVVLAAED